MTNGKLLLEKEKQQCVLKYLAKGLVVCYDNDCNIGTKRIEVHSSSTLSMTVLPSGRLTDNCQLYQLLLTLFAMSRDGLCKIGV